MRNKTTKNRVIIFMRRHFFALLLLTLVLYSCDKTYKYVEVVQEESILGGSDTKETEPTSIQAADDSSAYLEAYQNFCISIKVSKDMETSIGRTSSIPKSFKLYNDKGLEISNSVFFSDKDKRKKEIEERIFSMKNSIQESVDNNKKEKAESFKKTASVDSLKTKELLKSFRQKKDEYSNDNKIWYQPKSSPDYANANGIYCYFCTENGVPSNLRFRLQYYADDWLFIKSIHFSIDDKAYEYVPIKTETDNGDGGYIWEWFDESLSDSDKDLIYALANAKSAKMKLDGRQYYKEKAITKEQVNSIKKTLDLYKAMGGQY
jgi:hypothetical protein